MSERLDMALARLYPEFSRSRLKGLVEASCVRVNGALALKAGMKVAPGDRIEVEIPPPVPAEPVPEDIPLSVIYEDDSIIVIDKPPGIVVHPAPGHPGGTLVNALLHHCPGLEGIGGVARPGIVHRLDQDTSGVMVVAKTEMAMRSLARQFASHESVEKTYLALVHGRPPADEGRIENLIGRHPVDRKRMAVVERCGKQAITCWRFRGFRDGGGVRLGEVECSILTGRTHQIRVHMASLGCPVAGDAVYGRPRLDRQLSPPPSRQLLHAWRLKIWHPALGRSMEFSAPPPSDFSVYPAAATV